MCQNLQNNALDQNKENPYASKHTVLLKLISLDQKIIYCSCKDTFLSLQCFVESLPLNLRSRMFWSVVNPRITTIRVSSIICDAWRRWPSEPQLRVVMPVVKFNSRTTWKPFRTRFGTFSSAQHICDLRTHFCYFPNRSRPPPFQNSSSNLMNENQICSTECCSKSIDLWECFMRRKFVIVSKMHTTLFNDGWTHSCCCQQPVHEMIAR